MAQRDEFAILERFFDAAWKQIIGSPDPIAAMQAFFGEEPRKTSDFWVTEDMRKCRFCGKPFPPAPKAHWPYVVYCDDTCRDQGIKQLMGRGN